jgi:hypothetical protein
MIQRVMHRLRFFRYTPVLLAAAVGMRLLVGCAGQGEGEISGTLRVPICRLDGVYDLRPSFYGANREGRTLMIRIQNGGGDADYTDHLVISIDDTEAVAREIAASTEVDAMGRRVKTFPVGMRPSEPWTEPPAPEERYLIHASLHPNQSCGRTKVTKLGQVVGLWTYQGTMTFRAVDQQQPTEEEGLTEVTDFHLQLIDDRPVGTTAPADIDPDSPVGDGELSGWFRFYATRMVPANSWP